MEEVLCDKHGRPCMLKTGIRDGARKGKSFYICVDKQGCDFTQTASVNLKPSHCIIHEDSMVELQALTRDSHEQTYRLYYRCVVSKKAGQKWCGNVPWTPPEKENQNPLSGRPLQPSFLPEVRNPFKAPEKADHQDSEWKKMMAPGETEKKAREQTSARLTASQESRSKDCNGKDDAHSKIVEDEDSGRSYSSDSYRGKHLPPGMKVKKRVSNEERNVSKDDSEKNVVGEVKGKTKDGHRERCQETRNYSTASVKSPHTDEACEIQPNPDGASTQQPTGAIKTNETREETSHKTKESASNSSPVGIAQAGPEEDTRTSLSSDKPTKPHATHSKEQDKSRSDNASIGVDDDDDDDVLLVSVKPATQRTPPVASVQKTLTTFPGFQQSSQVRGQQEDPRELHSLLSAQLKQKKATLSVVNVSALPDKGERLKSQVKDLEDALESLSITAASQPESPSGASGGDYAKPAAPPCQSNPFSRQGGTVLLPYPPASGPLHLQASGSSSQGYSHMNGAQSAAFYGGRMTDDRMLAVKNATSEAIDHLHKSMESCPGPETEVSDPKGIKVTLLAHQRQALAWLLWRENQKPSGGILADDMGLGKTLTIIALILAQKKKPKEEDHKDDDGKKLDSWISKNDSGLVVSTGTLIICPASLIHHWKNEIDRHVKTGKLSVYLYHGPNRQRSARVLANHDVVVTTYSLVSKEIPVQKEDAERPTKDSDSVPSNAAPLLRVAWARVVLDEAHNIKNPKVQQSQAACRLRAQARWAVTGTPIQNNLLDMYSLLKFLRCSPFDEYKLWKAQVDNGSKRGGERLNLLTKSLLLRRMKDQRDSSGNPLVNLPDRTCEVHRVKLSEDEQAVYNVVFAQSRSTLQNYLKRHEGNDVNKGNTSTSNPFDKVAQEFGLSQSESAVTSSSQQAASTGVHIMSLLLRLRQCCCHVSLLKKTLDQTELQGDGIILSLEEQLNALCLSSSPSSDPDHKDTVSLNGSRFPAQLFESTCDSTKISAVMTELKEIKQKGNDQKSVIVSQWTSMLQVVAVHLQKLGLSYGVIDGSVPPKKRMDLVEEFNTNPKGPQVMLVSLCAGGVGLNLIGGNHLFLIDMHWNPALEDQACDRIYRVGQRKDVTIHRFVCEGTVEDKISILQEKKKELAQKVLSGTGSSVTKLSLADLRVIFGL